MQRTRLNLERTLFIFAFALGLLVRLLNLGTTPLSDSEASWALQAMNVSRSSGISSQTQIGPQPGYIFPTALIFEVFGSSNFLARIWPALAGSMMVLAPILLRRRIGRWPTIIAALGFALDPGLATVSRQAGGPILALSFSLLTLALWINKRHILAGISGGLALISGPAIYPGMIGLGIALLLLKSSSRSKYTGDKSKSDDEKADELSKEEHDSGDPAIPSEPQAWREALISAGLTILIVGTYFFRFPQGLAAWVQSLMTFLSGWASVPATSPLKLSAALIVYQPFAIFFGLIGIGRWLVGQIPLTSRGGATFRITLFWLLANLILVLIYPGRQVSDAVWVLAPLWILAAYELEHVIPEEQPNLISVLQAGLILVLSVLFWLTLVSTIQIPAGGAIPPAGIQAALLLGIIALGVLTTVLVALGWSVDISRYGLMWGAMVVAGIYLVAALWGATQLRSNQPEEFWGPAPATGQASLMEKTLTDLSNWNTGLVDKIEILSVVDNPSLRWALRDYANVRFSTFLPNSEMPPIILTSVDQESPALAATYRGQDFVWRTWPGWSGALPDDVLGWLTFRRASILSEKIILWARSDQFPGGTPGMMEIPATSP